MKQGVLLPYRVRLLLSDGHSCYRTRRAGERRRKSVRGCIVGPDIAVLSLVIVKQGESDVAGLTDVVLPKRLGPKRATKIRKFFNLTKEDDVRKYVVRREVVSKKKEGAKPYTKAYVVLYSCYHFPANLPFFLSQVPRSKDSSPLSVSNVAVTSSLSKSARSSNKRSRKSNTSTPFSCSRSFYHNF